MEPLEFFADKTIYCDDIELRFDNWMPLIPSKVIIHKTIPGFGATYTEIKAKRNSIIVLPNVATIHSKHNAPESGGKTFPVYEGVTSKHIIEYLLQDITYKKILTTPESLQKVIRAFANLNINGYKDYFVLMDEAHKLIQDVDYRPNITAAMDYFFRFDNLAMISSTPIKPSDPRFSGFKYIKLQPTYQYHKPVELLYQNNVVYALKDSFERNPNVVQCVFFNSINGIMDLIKKLGIGKDTMIFCSKESAGYIISQQYTRDSFFEASFKFEAELMKQYNFFTSSLYNGLDIILDSPPQVIMISLPTEPKTFLDPFTDVVQILGRFRNHEKDKGGIFAEAIHLLPNWGSGNFKNKSQVTEWLKANQTVYDTLLTLMYTNTKPLEKEIYTEALRRLPFHNFLANDKHLLRSNPAKPNYPAEEDPDKYDLDYFKVDNLYEEERVNSYYADGANLWHAYEQAGVVTIGDTTLKSFEIYLNERKAPHDELHKLNLRGGKRYSKENIKQLTYQLVELNDISGNLPEYDEAVFSLTSSHPLVRKAFDKLGPERIAELGFSIGKIKQALIDYDVKDGKNKNPVIDAAYSKFSTGIKIPLSVIKKELQEIYDHFEIPATAKATDILQWFEAKEVIIITYKAVKSLDGTSKRKTRHEQRAYILLKRKFNLHRFLGRT